MKKFLTVIFTSVMLLSVVNAYNPPVGAEDMCILSSPNTLSGSVTAAGGSLFNAGPDSIVINPALTAKEQRTSLNAGYTFLYSGNNRNESDTGAAIQTGILIPFSMFVFSGYTNFTSACFYDMYLGKSINAKAGLAKEITNKLAVGISVSGGYTWEHGTDWALGGNVGALYSAGNLGFMDDVRFGASVLNVGKNYSSVLRIPVDTSNSEISAYPTMLTLKVGAAGTLVKNDFMELGMALDVTTPFFQNLIVDFNTELCIKDSFVVSVAERFNVKEVINGSVSFIPSVGVFYRFTFGVKNNSYLESNGWSQSEMKVSGAYKNLYGPVHAISAGADINLGMKDTEAPEINIW